MWGFGGRFYWGRKERSDEVQGIVVVFARTSSEERHLKSYIELYASLGWNSLVFHSQFLNKFFPEKITALAANVLNELVEEIKFSSCPIVFASFSDGPEACMYKILQVIEEKRVEQANAGNYQLVQDCIAGYIFDSSPVDFTSDFNSPLVLHPSVLNISHPPRFVRWVVHGIASGFDALFLSRFESQRAVYWQTLYFTISMKVPYLILCSKDDDLAPYEIIHNFAQRLKELGADVKLVTWNGSPHVGHFRHSPSEYKVAVAELLGKAAMVYSQRTQQLEGEKMGLEGADDEISDLSKWAAVHSNRTFWEPTLRPNDQFLLPSSMEYYEGKDVGFVQKEAKEGLVHLPRLPSGAAARGVLGRVLFDVCVPTNVEDWDIRPVGSGKGRGLPSARRHNPFNPIRCLRSRL